MKGNLRNLLNNRIIQNLVTLLIIVILIYVIFKTIILLSHLTTPIDSNEVSSVSTIRDIFTILFYIIIATITIFSYFQARKTLFTPIKTEIFKLQMKNFEEVLIFFQNKNDLEFMDFFDFETIVRLNSQRMFDDYILAFFKNEIKIDLKAREEAYKQYLVGGVATPSYFEKHFVNPDYAISYDARDPDKAPQATDRALVLKEWRKYKNEYIGFTEKYLKACDRLNHLIASPLLPQKLKELITIFQKEIDSNLQLVGDVLTEVSQELPDKYPDINSIKAFNPLGFWNRYVDKRKKLDESVSNILAFINNYLKIEKLIG